METDRRLQVVAAVKQAERGHHVEVTVGPFATAEVAELFCARIGAWLAEMANAH